MKYYFYISDAKIDMLYDQIATPVETTTTSLLKGGVGNWLSIEHHEQTSKQEGTKTLQKLKKVLDWLRKKEKISTLESIESPWLEDIFSCYASYPVMMTTNIPVVLLHWQAPFDCKPIDADQHMLLVGSSAYLMPRAGNNNLQIPTLPPGGHWTELSVLLSGILDGTQQEKDLKDNGMWLLNSSDGPFGNGDTSKIIQVKAMIRVMHNQDIGSKKIILGSPLYVELIN
jgi:hypothetical protein